MAKQAPYTSSSTSPHPQIWEGFISSESNRIIFGVANFEAEVARQPLMTGKNAKSALNVV